MSYSRAALREVQKIPCVPQLAGLGQCARLDLEARAKKLLGRVA